LEWFYREVGFQIFALAPLRRSAAASPAHAVTEIMWWHAMSGELGRQLEKLATDFNASQSEYRIVPSYKGNYTETVTAAIFAFRSRSQPAIVQVNEIATATMMAAKGAIYPVFELMRDQAEAFSPAAYLPAVTGYYADVAGNMLSFPFNASTPILYYNKDLFRAAGLDPEVAPKTWPEVGAAAKRLRAAGAVAASPRRGRRGSMSRIFPRSTICRSRPRPTASAGSTRC
jgi:sn-glycerol 3-phosphate transport system substrate-binding protein